MKLNNTEKAVMRAIQKYYCSHGYSPSFREIAELTGLKSTASVHRNLTKLKNKDAIDFNPRQPRTIQILEEGCYD